MQLASPWSLLWLLLAIPLVALFLLRVKPRRVRVATIRFWNAAAPETQPRRWARTLRDPLFLLLLLMILCTLVLALTEPAGSSSQAAPRRVAVVLDGSASMHSADVLPNRWTAARTAAERLIDGLRPQDQLALISTGPHPRILAGLTSHPPSLHAALAAWQAAHTPDSLPPAIDLARTVLAGQSKPEVHVITDTAGYGAARTLTPEFEDVTLSWHTVGGSLDNLGITTFQARRTLDDLSGYQLLIRVVNASDRQQTNRLELTLDDGMLDVIPLALNAGEVWEKVLTYSGDSAGVIRGRLVEADRFSLDDVAVALVPVRPQIPVMLVTPGCPLLEQALRAQRHLRLSVVSSVPAQETLPPDVILVLHRQHVTTWPTRPALLLDLAEGLPEDSVGPELNETAVVEQLDHPALGLVELRDLTLRGVHAWDPAAGQANDQPSEVEVWATALDETPVVVHLRPQGSSLVVLNLDIERSELPWRTAFPLLISQVTQWLAGAGAELQAAVATGERVEWTVEPQAGEAVMGAATAEIAAAEFRLRSPQGRERRATTTSALPNILQLGPLDTVGLWSLVRTSGPPGTAARNATESGGVAPEEQVAARWACNLANAQESELRAAAQPDSQAATQGQLLGQPHRPLWFYAVACAMIMLAVEWWLYQRRRIG